jgi:hypothetical protein
MIWWKIKRKMPRASEPPSLTENHIIDARVHAELWRRSNFWIRVKLPLKPNRSRNGPGLADVFSETFKIAPY